MTRPTLQDVTNLSTDRDRFLRVSVPLAASMFMQRPLTFYELLVSFYLLDLGSNLVVKHGTLTLIDVELFRVAYRQDKIAALHTLIASAIDAEMPELGTPTEEHYEYLTTIYGLKVVNEMRKYYENQQPDPS